MPFTLNEADAVIQASRAKAEEMDIKVAISVVDGRGDLMAFARMDGARHITVGVSQGKAMVSAFFNAPSAALADAAGGPVFQSLIQMNQGRLVFGQGALPINRDGETVGAVGVSGATSQQDEEVAAAGLRTTFG